MIAGTNIVEIPEDPILNKYGHICQIEVKCPKCGNIQFYKIRKKVPKRPRTQCKNERCKSFFGIARMPLLMGKKRQNIGKKHARNGKLDQSFVEHDKWALNPEKVDLWSLLDKDLRDLFIKFVGFVGYLDKDGYAIIDLAGEIHRGEAIPEPYDEITREYKGIADYQADYILTFRDHENLLNIWGRRLGKTWKSAWIIQFTMKYLADKWLYFSLTDVAYKVANDVYVWAQSQDAIMDAETVKIRFGAKVSKMRGRKSGYQKFALINGAEYEVHGIRTASTLGYHGWNIVLDDVIDEQHKRLPHLQKALELKWDSQYSKIGRKKLMFDNTRKFAGDFFDFIINQFIYKSSEFERRMGYVSKLYRLHVSHKTPYVGLGFEGDVRIYRDWLNKLEKNKLPYDKTKIISNWHDPDYFEISKLENLKMFYAEMMGNPRPLEGGNWKKVSIVHGFDPADYEAICLVVDPAWTVSQASDETGLAILGLKKELKYRKVGNKKKGFRQYTVFRGFEKKLKIKAWTEEVDHGHGVIEKVEREGLLDWIESQFQWVRKVFEYVGVILVIIETNSGGQLIVDVAQSESDNYEFGAYIPDDETMRKLAYSKMEKEDRIDNSLFDVIKNGDMEFLDILEEGILIDQILHFPDSVSDHCIDALAKGKVALHKLKRVGDALERREVIERLHKERQRIREVEEWEANNTLKGYRKQAQERRSIFSVR